MPRLPAGESARLRRSAAGRAGKQVFARLLPGCDLIGGLEKVCQEHGIRAGSLDCLGSLNEAVMQNPSPKKEGKIVAGYGPPKRVPSPTQVLVCKGTISHTEDGEILIHMHGLFCNDKGDVFGGHVVKGENIVRTTMEVIINEVDGVNAVRRYDPEVGEPNLFPERS